MWCQSTKIQIHLSRFKGSWPYVDLLDSMYLVAQKLTRHDDAIYLVSGKMMHDLRVLNESKSCQFKH